MAFRLLLNPPAASSTIVMCGLRSEHCVSRIKVPQSVLGIGGGGGGKERGGGRSFFTSNSPQQPRSNCQWNSGCLQLCRNPFSKDANRHSLLCGLSSHISRHWRTYPAWWQEQLEHAVLQLLLCYGHVGKHCSPLPLSTCFRTKGTERAKKVRNCQLLSPVDLLGFPMFL